MIIITGKTHMVFACFSSIMYIKTADTAWIDIPLVISGAFNAAKLPDIDQKIHIFKHREFTHSFLIPLVLSYFIWYFHAQHFRYILIGFLIGWSSHMFIDMFNGSGIVMGYPLIKTRLHLMDIKYDDKGEKYIVYFLYSMCIMGIIGFNKIITAIFNYNWHPVINETTRIAQGIAKVLTDK